MERPHEYVRCAAVILARYAGANGKPQRCGIFVLKHALNYSKMNKPNTLNPTERAMVETKFDTAKQFILEQNRLPKQQRNARKLLRAKQIRDTLYRWLNGHNYKPYHNAN
jgi:hypothetical protein